MVARWAVKLGVAQSYFLLTSRTLRNRQRKKTRMWTYRRPFSSGPLRRASIKVATLTGSRSLWSAISIVNNFVFIWPQGPDANNRPCPVPSTARPAALRPLARWPSAKDATHMVIFQLTGVQTKKEEMRVLTKIYWTPQDIFLTLVGMAPRCTTVLVPQASCVDCSSCAER